MTDTTTPADDQCCEVPLIEQLRSVPIDARQMIEIHATEHRNIPYGRLCHAAANALEARAASQPSGDREALIARLRRIVATMANEDEDAVLAAIEWISAASQPAQEPDDPYFLGLCHTLLAALKRLSFAAQTSGGTAGRDEELCGAIAQAESAINASKGYPPEPAQEPEWVVNDIAELGVKIGGRFFWLYKGRSLEYKEGKHDDGSQMHWRPVFKREFGECCHPVNYKDPTRIGTVSLTDSDDWLPLPDAAPPADYVPMAEYKKLQELVTSQGIRLMEADDAPPADTARPAQEPVFTTQGPNDSPEHLAVIRKILAKEPAQEPAALVDLSTPEPRLVQMAATNTQLNTALAAEQQQNAELREEVAQLKTAFQYMKEARVYKVEDT